MSSAPARSSSSPSVPNVLAPPHSSPLQPGSATPTALWAVLTFTFLNSIGSAVATGGIFFLARHDFGFSTAGNFGLSLVWGLSYIPAAGGAGWITRGFQRLGVSPRAMLVLLMLGMGTVCWLPWAAQLLAGSPGAVRWPLWVVMAVYSLFSGVLWPNTEAFLAGGRSDRELSSATGKFNISWSVSLVISLIAMGPMLEKAPMLMLPSLGVVHFLTAGVLAWFPAQPGRHEHHAHVVPARSVQLLSVLRLLLPVSFMFISALAPYLPEALALLGVSVALKTTVASTWYAARVGTFFTLERWHGWRGLWRTPVVGMLVLLVGFGLAILGPRLGGTGHGTSLGMSLLLTGLAGFGVGVGIIYAAALYYAMEVGSSGVDAGGTHEMVIGLGYAAGPACGLLAAQIDGGRAALPGGEGSAAWIMMGIVCSVALVVSAFAAVRVLGHTRTDVR